MTGSIILNAVYGYDASPQNDYLVNLVESAINHLSEAALPSSELIGVPDSSIFTWLKIP